MSRRDILAFADLHSPTLAVARSTLLRRRFVLGEIDFRPLSAGRERFLRIQSDALGAQQEYFLALAELERAVGADAWSGGHQEGRYR